MDAAWKGLSFTHGAMYKVNRRFKLGFFSPPQSRLQILCAFAMLTTLLAGFLFLSGSVEIASARRVSTLQENLLPHKYLAENVTHSLNVSTCPGMSHLRTLIVWS